MMVGLTMIGSERNCRAEKFTSAVSRDPSLRFDFVNRRKLDFCNAAKRLMSMTFAAKVTFAGRQDARPGRMRVFHREDGNLRHLRESMAKDR